jgi:hypothetical protein
MGRTCSKRKEIRNMHINYVSKIAGKRPSREEG